MQHPKMDEKALLILLQDQYHLSTAERQHVSIEFDGADGTRFTYDNIAYLASTSQLTQDSALPQDLGFEQAFSAYVGSRGYNIPSTARSATLPAAPISESSRMGAQEDAAIPKLKFLPKPEGWKGDAGNPNFRTLGTLSPPVMRKIEPAGPHFLAFARRVSSHKHMPHFILTIN
jgi:hypothetical protein